MSFKLHSKTINQEALIKMLEDLGMLARKKKEFCTGDARQYWDGQIDAFSITIDEIKISFSDVGQRK